MVRGLDRTMGLEETLDEGTLPSPEASPHTMADEDASAG